MTCNEIRSMLSAFLDGELSAEDAQAVRQHLDRCDACKREYRLLEQTWQMLQEAEEIEPSSDFAREFWQKARQSLPVRRERRALSRLLIWGPAMAAGLAVAFLAGWFSAGGRAGSARIDYAGDIAFLNDYEMLQEMDLLENLPVLQSGQLLEVEGEDQ